MSEPMCSLCKKVEVATEKNICKTCQDSVLNRHNNINNFMCAMCRRSIVNGENTICIDCQDKVLHRND